MPVIVIRGGEGFLRGEGGSFGSKIPSLLGTHLYIKNN